MKITKYIHSCLLFEQDSFKLLFDPGKFSFAEGLVKPGTFSDVSAIIITHNHPDHLDKENLKEILHLSNAIVYTNAQVAEELQQEGIQAQILTPGINQLGPFKLKVFPVVHEAILDSKLPEMIAFLINDAILHPVDSFEKSLQQYKGIELLILPIMAPFTTELKVAAFADQLCPKQILPVHDGYAKEFFLEQRYKSYTEHFENQAITFHQMRQVGNSIEM